MSSFVKQADVEQEQFDWGTIGWRCRPANTGSKQLVVMDVTLEPGEGHAFHRHPGQEEMIIVKQGSVTQYLEQDSTTLNPGDADVVVVSYTSPGYTGGHDTVRVIARYTSPLGSAIADTGKKRVVVPLVEVAPVVRPM